MTDANPFDLKANPIGNGRTKHGFDCNGVARVIICCQGKERGRPWAVISVILADGTVVNIDASRRKHWTRERKLGK